MTTRRTFFTTAGAFGGAAWAAGLPAALLADPAMPSPRAIAGQVRDEFVHAWNGYNS